ncbi:hypothetical protein [Chryseobacterium oranimense]|uniref:hypothetical protein n=1 Tax=Chryseobacterium oranimense TaxID=421058 RepID=UPI0022363AC5|nr:hypothetical protein [Chryseobacterium oranimense]
MIKKLLLGCLFMTAVLSSCNKDQNSSSAKDSEKSIQIVSMVTCATMAVALLVAYNYKRR